MRIDVCTWNGEKELWDLHYNVLKDAVDELIVIEFDTTFSGKPRSEVLFEGIDKSLYPKANFIRHTEGLYGKYAELAESSPNTEGAAHWKREFMQKESTKDALEYLKVQDNDRVFIGDVDEIWDPDNAYIVIEPFKIELFVYTYWLNNRSTEKFYGTLVCNYRDVKDKCLNHMRSDSFQEITGPSGWHFTSMGGADAVHKKLTDSYTQESYAIPAVLASLEGNIESGRDFLGRDFAYKIDESEWPQYLKNHREEYAHLCKEN